MAGRTIYGAAPIKLIGSIVDVDCSSVASLKIITNDDKTSLLFSKRDGEVLTAEITTTNSVSN